jgi:hypothetical protein
VLEQHRPQRLAELDRLSELRRPKAGIGAEQPPLGQPGRQLIGRRELVAVAFEVPRVDEVDNEVEVVGEGRFP